MKNVRDVNINADHKAAVEAAAVPGGEGHGARGSEREGGEPIIGRWMGPRPGPATWLASEAQGEGGEGVAEVST